MLVALKDLKMVSHVVDWKAARMDFLEVYASVSYLVDDLAAKWDLQMALS